MLKKSLFAIALGLTLTSGLTATALAQSTTGTLSGTVLDPSGALIPDAQVTISNSAGFSMTTESSDIGAFQAPNLSPGDYSVSINATGFTPALESGIEVSGNKATEESIKLGISVTQEIDVWATDDGAPTADSRPPAATSNER